MLRSTPSRCGTVYVRLIDSMRINEGMAKSGVLFPVNVDLGDGVAKLGLYDFQTKIDAMMQRSQRFSTVKTGIVYDANKRPVTEVHAGQRYIVTGNLGGGYVKNDMRFGLRLTGYNAASPKPGLKWNGENL